MTLAMFHKLMRHARHEVKLARDFRELGQDRLAADYLALAFARRRAAHGYRRVGGK